MKVLFSVNTVYQLMMVVNMRMHNIPNAEADIVVSDHTPILIEYVENIKNSKLFGSVFYHTSLEFNKYFWALPSDKAKADAYKNSKNEISQYVKDSGIDYNAYTDVYLANADGYFKFVRNSFPHLKFTIFEDGAGTCAVNWKEKSKRWNFIENFNTIYDEIEDLYIYSPELMCVDLGYKIHVLPKIDNKDKQTIGVFNKIFGFDPKSIKLPRVVFAEQAFQVDRIKNNDMDFIEATYDVVGYNNLYIKTHPRNTINRSFIQGISKQDDIKIPFELLLLNCDIEKTIFVTISSGSLISPWVVFDANIITIFLYKAIKGDINLPTIDKFREYLDKLVEKNACKKLYVPKSLTEYKYILKRLVDEGV